MNTHTTHTANRVSFDVPEEVDSLIGKVVDRVKRQKPDDWSEDGLLQLRMSLTACHANGCPVDWARLLEADNFSFYHDVCGIQLYISKSTGQLTGNFRPHHARPHLARPQGARS